MDGRAMLADLLLAAHFLFVVFVVGGEAAILAGAWRGWRWVRAPRWRRFHLGSIALVILYGIAPGYCPLTRWEYELRLAAGQNAEAGSFVGRLLQRMLFLDLPEWVFFPLYAAFALLIVATMIWIPPRRGNLTMPPGRRP
jgi:hypothetical protein